ncbi:MAG: protein-L-isoaspartate(D-aspartate) O-methyltransferase [Planctomycetota bacterium]|nr:protein-L-isoaspartate(D-aspartate) O-methyltransferase [Planctomycetota bacterium]
MLEDQRRDMVSRQLIGRGIRCPRVLEAIGRVPREEFLDPHSRCSAYADRALPIECEQTISQPYMVALMTEALTLDGCETVLEIGAGCGYQTAVLLEMGVEVISLERHRVLARRAQDNLRHLGYDRRWVIHIADGTQGWPDAAPYDCILLAAAAENCPGPLWQQLKEGGILVAPFGARSQQMLCAIRKVDGAQKIHEICACRFVPLVAGLPFNDVV